MIYGFYSQLFISTGPAEGPYLIAGGKALTGQISDDGNWIIPCIVSNLNSTIELFKLQKVKVTVIATIFFIQFVLCCTGFSVLVQNW